MLKSNVLEAIEIHMDEIEKNDVVEPAPETAPEDAPEAPATEEVAE